MLDLAFFRCDRGDPDLLRTSLRRRGSDVSMVDRVMVAQTEHQSALQAANAAKAVAKRDRTALQAAFKAGTVSHEAHEAMRQASVHIKQLTEVEQVARRHLHGALRAVPNIVHASVPWAEGARDTVTLPWHSPLDTSASGTASGQATASPAAASPVSPPTATWLAPHRATLVAHGCVGPSQPCQWTERGRFMCRRVQRAILAALEAAGWAQQPVPVVSNTKQARQALMECAWWDSYEAYEADHGAAASRDDAPTPQTGDAGATCASSSVGAFLAQSRGRWFQSGELPQQCIPIALGGDGDSGGSDGDGVVGGGGAVDCPWVRGESVYRMECVTLVEPDPASWHRALPHLVAACALPCTRLGLTWRTVEVTAPHLRPAHTAAVLVQVWLLQSQRWATVAQVSHCSDFHSRALRLRCGSARQCGHVKQRSWVRHPFVIWARTCRVEMLLCAVFEQVHGTGSHLPELLTTVSDDALPESNT